MHKLTCFMRWRQAAEREDNQHRMEENTQKNLWGGRFQGEADAEFTEFNRSFGFDRRLFEADVRASLAHCDGLAGAGVLAPDEAQRLRSALATILESARRPGYLDEI